MSSSREQLARLRAISAKDASNALRFGKELLGGAASDKGKTRALGDEEWSIREQTAIAALEEGDLDYAKAQISLLSRQFPASPRVVLLHGLAFEAAGDFASARLVYQVLLGTCKEPEKAIELGTIVKGLDKEGDECFIPARQRLIALSLAESMGANGELDPKSLARSTLPPLIDHLSTFYTDPEGWSLLADLYCFLSGYGGQARATDAAYASGQLYERALSREEASGDSFHQAMSCVGQRMLLEPWNWMEVVRYGEIALVAGDPTLAFKTLLRAIEMATDPDAKNDPSVGPRAASSAGDLPGEIMQTGGWEARPWWDIKLAITALRRRTEAATESLSPTAPHHVDAIDRLATTRLGALVGSKAIERWEQLVKTPTPGHPQ